MSLFPVDFDKLHKYDATLVKTYCLCTVISIKGLHMLRFPLNTHTSTEWKSTTPLCRFQAISRWITNKVVTSITSIVNSRRIIEVIAFLCKHSIPRCIWLSTEDSYQGRNIGELCLLGLFIWGEPARLTGTAHLSRIILICVHVNESYPGQTGWPRHIAC